MTRIATVCLVAFLAASAAQAGPVQPGQVSETAEWLVHIDCDAAVGVPHLKTSIDQLLKSKAIDKTVERLSFLREAAWHGVTAVSLEEEHVVVLLDTDVKAEWLVPLLEREAGYARVKYGQHIVHHFLHAADQEGSILSDLKSVNAEDEDEDEDPFYVCFYEEGLMVVSSRLADVNHQLDVLDGKRASVAAGSLAYAKELSGEPTIALYQSFVDPEEGEPTCLYLALSGKEKMHVASSWDMGSDMMANMAMQYAKPETLVTMFKGMVEQIKQQQEAEKTEGEEVAAKDDTEESKQESGDADDEDEKGQHGRIMIGADFKGKDFDEDRAEILAFVRKSLQVKRQDRVVTVNWSSFVESELSYKVKDGFHDFMFQLHIQTDEQAATKTAERVKQSKR